MLASSKYHLTSIIASVLVVLWDVDYVTVLSNKSHRLDDVDVGGDESSFGMSCWSESDIGRLIISLRIRFFV